MKKLILLLGLFFSLIVWAETGANTLKRRTLLQNFTPSSDQPRIAVAFFDADGTLRPTTTPGAPVNNSADVVLLPHVAEKIKELVAKNYFIVIVSNQGGIPRYCSLEQADQALYRTAELITQAQGVIHYYDFAENYDQNRKPNIGMAQHLDKFLQTKFGKPFDLSRSLMIGDSGWVRSLKGLPADIRPDGREGYSFSNADRKFAENLQIPYIEAATFFNWRKLYGIDNFDTFTDLARFYQQHPNFERPSNLPPALTQMLDHTNCADQLKLESLPKDSKR